MLAMSNAERLTQGDVDEAKAAFAELVRFCTRRASEGRPIDEDDFRAATLSQDAYWPYGGYKSVWSVHH